MEGADWWARGLGLAGFLISLLAVGLSWRWRRGDRLFAVHESLRKLKSAALQHLDVETLEHPNEEDLRDLRASATYLVGRTRWPEVRRAAQRLLDECERVAEPRARERPIERKDALRRDINEAFETVAAALGARADEPFVAGVVDALRRRLVRD